MSVPKPPAGESYPYVIPHRRYFNDIDVELTVGTHGAEHTVPELGPMILGVTDTEYDNLAQKVDALKPERGDAFTTEGLDNNACVGAADWLNYDNACHMLCQSASQTAYLRPRMYPDKFVKVTSGDKPAGFLRFPRIPIAVHPDIIPNLLEDLRQLRAISPFEYGQIRAVLQNVPAASVDAFSGGFNAKNANGYRRNIEMARVLSDAAMEVTHKRREQPSEERARLVYAVGEAHLEPLSYIFDKNNIQYEATYFGPPWQLSRFARLFTFLGLSNFAVSLPVSKSRQGAGFQAWIANAEAFREERW